MKDKKIGILFDLDGTLWDSSEAVIESWNEVIEQQPDFHKKGTIEDMMHLMGKTMTEIAYEFFDTVSKERAMELMTLCTDHENEYLRQHGGVLMPALEETLKLLSEKYFLAIVSNCQQGYIEAFLEYHGLEQYFDDHEDFGTTLKPKADNIALVMQRNNLEKTFYLGDVQGDCDSAIAAGATFIHAAYGYGEIPSAEYRINAFEELPKLMERLA
ncbi:MAG: HAD family hydrolase [Lachnospiraceae bacterium]|nr:HAD family hydrolase [Lachnospiraceae bacterium]